MTCAPNISALSDAVLDRIGLFRNSYFLGLSSGSLSLPQFRESQEQFFYAVRYFPRPIAALMSRLPDPSMRVGLLQNVVEEHGDFRELQFHQNTFRQFLTSIGARHPSPNGSAMRPAVHAFNSILMAACLADELSVGVCCLGIIEKSFATLSAMIGRAVVDRGWVKAQDLTHYALHAELDVRHADDMFAIVEPRFDELAERLWIQQGLELGAYAFDQLYRGLLLEAEVANT